MNIKSILLAGALALSATVSVAGAALADPAPGEHPRQEQVLGRAAHERHLIREERREGEISGVRAHRLLVRDRHIVHEERRFARRHHGHITRREQLRLNRHENRLRRGVRG